MSKGFSVFTAFKAKDGLTPAFKNMTKGSNVFTNSIRKTKGQLGQFGSCVQQTCGKLNTMINATLGFVAFDAIKDKVNSFIDSASNLQETVGKTGEVFKNNSAEVENWAKTSIKSMGLAEQTALDTASLFGDMGTGMGMTTKRAAEMSMNLTQLSADLASFKNVEQGVAANALKGIFTGETEALKNMGVVMTETVLQEYARANGIRKKMKDMTQAEKIELRYQYVMKATTNAQGDFTRTFGNYANQKRVGEQLRKQAEINIGQIMLPVWNRFMVLYNTFFTNNLDKITKTFDSFFKYVVDLGKAFKPVFDELGKTFEIFGTQFVPMLVELGPPLKNLFETILVPALILAIGAFNKLFELFVATCNFVSDNWIPIVSVLAGVGGMLALKKAFDLVTGAIAWYNTTLMVSTGQGIAALSGFAKLKFMLSSYTAALWQSVKAIAAQTVALLANPWTWVAIGIAAVVAAIILLWKNWDKVVNFLRKTWDGLVELFQKSVDWLTTSTFGKIISALFPIVGVIALIAKNWGTITEVMGAWWDNTVAWLTGFWNKCSEVFAAVGNIVRGWISGLWETVQSIFGMIGNFIKNNFVNILMAAMGPVAWLIGGVVKLGQSIGKLRNGGQSGANNQNGGTPANFNQSSNQFNGSIDVGVKIDNSTLYPASSSMNLTSGNGLTLNPSY